MGVAHGRVGPVMGGPMTRQLPPDPARPLVRSPPAPHSDFLPLSPPQAPRGKALHIGGNVDVAVPCPGQVLGADLLAE